MQRNSFVDVRRVPSKGNFHFGQKACHYVKKGVILLTIKLKDDVTTIALVGQFLQTVNLTTAHVKGYLHMVSDNGLTSALKKMMLNGNYTICALHDINCLQNRVFHPHLENVNKPAYARYQKLVKFFPKARKKDPLAKKSLNDHLKAVYNTAGFTEMCETFTYVTLTFDF